MKLIKKHQTGSKINKSRNLYGDDDPKIARSKINKSVNFEKLDYYDRVGLYGDDYHRRAQKFLGVEDPESYLDALHNLNWDNKIIPELNSYYKNNPNARNAYIGKRERIENEIENKHNKDVFIELQKRLKEMGLYDGQIDGIWGPKSEKAKDEYQKLRSISPNSPSVRFLYSPEKK